MDMDEWCKKASAERAVREALQEAQIKAALVKYAAPGDWQVWTYNLPALSIKLIGPRNRMVEAIAVMEGWYVNGKEGDDLAAMLDDATGAGGRAIGG